MANEHDIVILVVVLYLVSIQHLVLVLYALNPLNDIIRVVLSRHNARLLRHWGEAAILDGRHDGVIGVGRTLVLPRLFPHVSYDYWDSGLGPWMGSMVCGLSVFIEQKRKRAEMALYVAPRALFAVAEAFKPGWLSQSERSALRAER